jgi:methylmalonyl-CoA carboxyltransferase large subunit
MKSETVDYKAVVEAIDELRQELSRLGKRVAALEGVSALPAATPAAAPAVGRPTVTAPQPASPPAKPVVGNVLNEELILTISAAIAAFLGKKPHIRQIRLIGSTAWAQQGRVMIQASHALSVPSPRS